MDINLLVVNVGNSRLSLGVFEAGELKSVRRMDLDDQSNLQGVITELWNTIATSQQPAVAGASVNPAAKAVIEPILERATSQKIQWVGEAIDLPIDVLTEEPKATGVDRILNVAAAYEQMQKACIVVDAGTAITVDLCNDQGQFVGGAISPGVRMMLDAMHEHTAALPQVQFVPPSKSVGRNTRQAMLHGVYHGVRGMVKELAENYASEIGTWPEIISTGGDAQALFSDWELMHAVAPDLTLYGVALAYANHHIKHDT